MTRREGLASRLRVMILTTPEPACGRPLPEVVSECLAAGATAIQLRDKAAEARALSRLAADLLERTRAANAILIVNDRLDVAVAVGADGVHLGPDDLPVAAARRIAPPGFLIGYSTDDPDVARSAVKHGADYLGVGAVYGTRSKPGLEGESIGPDGVRRVLEAADIPCLGIGGITADNATPVLETGAGVAVLSAVMHAPAPARVVQTLLDLADST